MGRCPFDLDYAVLESAPSEALLAGLREESPVVRITSADPRREGYLVTRREDVVKVASDPETFSSVGNPQGERFTTFNDRVAEIYRSKGWPISPVLVWIDKPEHTRFRKVVDRIFTQRRVEERSEHIRLCIEKAIAGFPRDGRIEAMADYAFRVPAMVMTREFGAPEDDYGILLETTNAVGASVDFTRTAPEDVQGVVEAAAHAATTFQQYMAPRIERVRREPENTMLSELANARDGDDYALTMQQLQSLLITFLIAATHSTTGALGWTLHTLATHPEVQARLRAEPERIEAFNEEVLRMHGTVATSYRTATRDVTLGGVDIPKGAQVLVRWDSANFDEDYWAEPGRFDLDRRNLRAHSTFGHGMHFCVGNTLARREMLLSVREFLRRYAEIAIDADAPPPRIIPSTNVSVLERLPLRLVNA